MGSALQHISFEFRKLTWYKNNSWKIEISIFCKIFKKKWKIHDYDTTSLSHIIMNFRAIWVLVPSKFHVFSKVFEFLKFYKILSFLVKICLYGWKQIFRWSWQLHFSQNSWKTDKIQKIIIFLKTLEKTWNFDGINVTIR